MQNQVTLVTGATGLLGNNVARALVERGRSVRVLVRNPQDNRSLQGLDLEIVQGDICDADSVRRACEGADFLVHSAGIVQIGSSNLEKYRAINVEGARNAARGARKAGARMIHVSSCDAVGSISNEEAADEETPFSSSLGVSYVISKREAEQAVQEEIAQGLDAVIVNPGFMLGPWDWKPSSGRMLLEVAKGKGRFAPRGSCSICDVRDVAAGVLAAIEKGQCGRRYILAGETMAYLDAWRLFAEVTGAPRPLFSPPPLVMLAAGFSGDFVTRLTGREPDINSAAIALAKRPKHYSSQRAKDELGYQTRPVRQSVEDAWAWFLEHGYA